MVYGLMAIWPDCHMAIWPSGHQALWPMASFLWRMAYGAWRMAYDAWPTAGTSPQEVLPDSPRKNPAHNVPCIPKLWAISCGPSVVTGRQWVVGGRWHAVCGRWQTVGGRWCAMDRGAIGSRRWAVGRGRWVVGRWPWLAVSQRKKEDEGAVCTLSHSRSHKPAANDMAELARRQPTRKQKKVG